MSDVAYILPCRNGIMISCVFMIKRASCCNVAGLDLCALRQHNFISNIGPRRWTRTWTIGVTLRSRPSQRQNPKANRQAQLPVSWPAHLMVIVERLSSVLFPLINQQNVSKQVQHTAGMLQNVRFSQCLPKQHNSHHSHTPQSDWLVQDAAGSAVGRMVRL